MRLSAIMRPSGKYLPSESAPHISGGLARLAPNVAMRGAIALALACAMVFTLTGCSANPTTWLDWLFPHTNDDASSSQALVPDTSVQVEGSPGLLGRSTLSSDQQQVYDQIYSIVASHQESGKVSATDTSELGTIYTSVLDDNPQIFWASGKGTYTVTGSTTTFTPEYTMDQTQQSQVQAQLDQSVSAYQATLPTNASDYQKVKAAYEYVITNADYDLNATHAHDVLGVLVYGSGVCDSYAKAIQYLLTQEGVWSGFVWGTTNDGSAHAWNAVLVDGKWCYVDATWGDPSFDNGGDANGPTLTYSYLCISGSDMTASGHVPDTSFQSVLPADADTTNAYDWYVMNNALVDSPNSRLATASAQTQLDADGSTFTIKFTSTQAYDEAKQELSQGSFLQDVINSYVSSHPDASTYTYATFDRIRVVWVCIG